MKKFCDTILLLYGKVSKNFDIAKSLKDCSKSKFESTKWIICYCTCVRYMNRIDILFGSINWSIERKKQFEKHINQKSGAIIHEDTTETKKLVIQRRNYIVNIVESHIPFSYIHIWMISSRLNFFFFLRKNCNYF